MYFDIDCRVKVVDSELADSLALVAREISKRRGSVIALSTDVLVFSAPFWRVYGLLYFWVHQLPLGVSHGVLHVQREADHFIVRLRISLFWLRLCVTAIVLLLFYAVLNPSFGSQPVLWILLLAGIAVGSVVYAVAVLETRRFFTRLLLDGFRTASGAR